MFCYTVVDLQVNMRKLPRYKRESKEEIQNNQMCNFKTVQAINPEFGDFFQNLRGNILTLVSRNSPPLMFP